MRTLVICQLIQKLPTVPWILDYEYQKGKIMLVMNRLNEPTLVCFNRITGPRLIGRDVKIQTAKRASRSQQDAFRSPHCSESFILKFFGVFCNNFSRKKVFGGLCVSIL